MTDNGIVPLRCQPAALLALAADLRRVGPARGEPDWLVSGVWLCTKDQALIATSSTEVLADGHVARPLKIDSVAELLVQIEADLPDVDGRLLGHGVGITLTQTLVTPEPPADLQEWDCEGQSVAVLVRKVERAKTTHRVACGLLFTAGAKRVLVATDPSMLAMVFSEDASLISAYRKRCDELSIDQYLREATA